MKKYLFCFFVSFNLLGCATTGMVTPIGFSVVNVTQMPGGMGYDRGKDLKSGKSCSHNILGLVAFGDSSITAAKSNGGIDKVSYFDTDIINVLGYYGRVCTIV